MKSFIITIACVLGLTLAACSSPSAEETLRQAEQDLRSGNVDLAVSSCKALSDTVNNDLSSTQLCRVAIIYAKVSELTDDLDYMASATRCYERAVSLDNTIDSLDRYIQTLDIEDQSVVRVIREVSQALASPCQVDDDGFENEYDEACAPTGGIDGYDMPSPQANQAI